ncbi:BZ3500_MvSof-1268-A1-R1_Chr10-4g03096 [Microbotryum saponariae]|uniref:BZ3500_MvSof-1268-A1-R1_Chr10-4g03096 protein n=1 Tax=Microbotryum saponariae TaxID=289078 RepID=A0A2X0M3N9_9BASI|nr:BZ3501_MvSof-1269-A2-R1_Chr10-2g02671 [Microbotryum saponariae]SDA01140.1 BZ3500_MvSof-1268-A1-R1_Chr10-4g03096 [Microbotryum saponariae]
MPLPKASCEVIVLDSDFSEDDEFEIVVVGPTLARPIGSLATVGAARPAASTARASTGPLTRQPPPRPPLTGPRFGR